MLNCIAWNCTTQMHQRHSVARAAVGSLPLPQCSTKWVAPITITATKCWVHQHGQISIPITITIAPSIGSVPPCTKSAINKHWSSNARRRFLFRGMKTLQRGVYDGHPSPNILQHLCHPVCIQVLIYSLIAAEHIIGNHCRKVCNLLLTASLFGKIWLKSFWVGEQAPTATISFSHLPPDSPSH